MRRERGPGQAPPTDDPFDRVRRHRYGDLVAELTADASFLAKPMFGCLACYLHGRLMLVLADRRPPWRGLLVPTAHAHQRALQAEVPALRVHPVLGKWLYLREGVEGFEEAAARLVALACADDPHLGVESLLPARAARTRPRVPPSGSRARARVS